jgi:hypothetical protein
MGLSASISAQKATENSRGGKMAKQNQKIAKF